MKGHGKLKHTGGKKKCKRLEGQNMLLRSIFEEETSEMLRLEHGSVWC